MWPASSHVNGNLQTFPRPTDIEIQDIRNSIGLSQVCRSGSSPASSFLPSSLMKLFSRNRGTLVRNTSSSFSSISPTLLGFLTILLPLRLTMLLLLQCNNVRLMHLLWDNLKISCYLLQPCQRFFIIYLFSISDVFPKNIFWSWLINSIIFSTFAARTGNIIISIVRQGGIFHVSRTR